VNGSIFSFRTNSLTSCRLSTGRVSFSVGTSNSSTGALFAYLSDATGIGLAQVIKNKAMIIAIRTAIETIKILDNTVFKIYLFFYVWKVQGVLLLNEPRS
jgi:hypothetical protein